MRTFILIILTFIYFSSTAQNQSIHLNSLGFLPQLSKKASIVGEAKSFVIKQATNQKVVFKGKISGPVFQKDVNQNVSVADFVAIMAQAARYFEQYDKTYSQKCLLAAQLSYEFLRKNPQDKGFAQGEFNTNEIAINWQAALVYALAGFISN